jgi:hypothetical protein
MENARQVRDIYLSTKPVTNKLLTSRYPKVNQLRSPLREANQYSHYFHDNAYELK